MLAQYLNSSFSAGVFNLRDYSEFTTQIEKLSTEAADYYTRVSDSGEQAKSHLYVHYFSAYGMQNYRCCDLKETQNWVGPFNYKDTQQFDLPTNLRNKDLPHLLSKTVNPDINKTAGAFISFLPHFYATKETVSKYFEGVEFVTQEIDKGEEQEKAIQANENSQKVHLIILEDFFNENNIKTIGAFGEKNLANFLATTKEFYGGCIKLVFLKLPDQKVPDSLMSYVMNLDSERDVEEYVTEHLHTNVCFAPFEKTKHASNIEKTLLTSTVIEEATHRIVSTCSILPTEYKALSLIDLKLFNVVTPLMKDKNNEFISNRKFSSDTYETIISEALEILDVELKKAIEEEMIDKGISIVSSNRGKLIGASNFTNLIEQIKFLKEHPQEAKEFGLTPPRGILLLGEPGVGKTLSVEYARDTLKLPAYRFEFQKYTSSLYGETDKNITMILNQIAKAGGILFIDEIEKLFGSANSDNTGITNRIINIFLQWMERDEAKNVIVIATSNRPNKLSSEFLRRFEYKFLFEAPDSVSRQDIIKFCLDNHKITYEPGNIQDLAADSETLTGFEISVIIKDAVLCQFARDKNNRINFDHLTNQFRSKSGSKSNSRIEYYSDSEFMNWCNVHQVRRATNDNHDLINV